MRWRTACLLLRRCRWEYPFFAAWDTAFHCIPLAVVDPAFAKKQLDLLTREWYMKPDGQIPAYEWNFSDVNPPVHAWYVVISKSAIRILFYSYSDITGQRLEYSRSNENSPESQIWPSWNGCFRNCYSTSLGGLIGKIREATMSSREGSSVWTILALSTGPSRCLRAGIYVRPMGRHGWHFIVLICEWFGIRYCSALLKGALYPWCRLNIALELAKNNPVYEDIASKFFEVKHALLV